MAKVMLFKKLLRNVFYQSISTLGLAWGREYKKKY